MADEAVKVAADPIPSTIRRRKQKTVNVVSLGISPRKLSKAKTIQPR